MDKELNTSLGRVSGLYATSGTSVKPKEDCKEKREKREGGAQQLQSARKDETGPFSRASKQNWLPGERT